MKKIVVPLLAAALLIAVVALLVARELASAPQGAKGTAREYVLPPNVTGASAPYVVAARYRVDMEAPSGVASGPGGRIYVAGAEEVVVFDASGAVEERFDIEGPAYCIAVDPNGNAFIGIGDSVAARSAETGELTFWASLGEGSIITSIAADGERVYVADAGLRKVWEYDGGGMFRGFIDEGFVIPSPYFDVAIDSGGSLWIADTGRHTLMQIGEDRQVSRRWGRYAMDVSGFSGCCNPAHFAVLPDGGFITSEKGLQRIKAHSGDGTFAGILAMGPALGTRPEGLDIAASAIGEVYVLRTASREVVKYRREGD